MEPFCNLYDDFVPLSGASSGKDAELSVTVQLTVDLA